MIVILSVIEKLDINLIPIYRAPKQLFTIIDRFLMVFKVWTSVGADCSVI